MGFAVPAVVLLESGVVRFDVPRSEGPGARGRVCDGRGDAGLVASGSGGVWTAVSTPDGTGASAPGRS